MCDNDELKETVKEFLSYLDYVEESDSGREFHPIHISCSRIGMYPKVSGTLNKLKLLVKD